MSTTTCDQCKETSRDVLTFPPEVVQLSFFSFSPDLLLNKGKFITFSTKDNMVSHRKSFVKQ